MRYVFGPVASRRLGVSLGVDLVQAKTCSFDCIYCESGATTDLTLERREYVPVDDVIAELDRVLHERPKIDWVTFSGSGEPTLNSGLGRVTNYVKDHYPEYRICLLTNGTLLSDPSVVRDIERIDRIVPSLDASSAEEFSKINRPVSEMDFESFMDGMTEFCRTAKQEIHLELFIVPGVNDSDESIVRFADLIRQMKVDLVQLNTLDRPGVEAWLRPSDPSNTRRFIAALEPFVPVEAIGPFRYRTVCEKYDASLLGDSEKRILELICRRPATEADLELALERPAAEIRTILERLFSQGIVEMERKKRGMFYSAPQYRS